MQGIDFASAEWLLIWTFLGMVGVSVFAVEIVTRISEYITGKSCKAGTGKETSNGRNEQRVG